MKPAVLKHAADAKCSLALILLTADHSGRMLGESDSPSAAAFLSLGLSQTNLYFLKYVCICTYVFYSLKKINYICQLF